MKKIILYIIVALTSFYSCQKPQFVEPTADRQGITSLTAYFTSGKYVDQVLAKLEIDDPNLDRYVIPVPWFYPEESEDVTTIHMTRVRVRAELATNCKIDPPITILDLTQENKFTYTNAQGESRDIIITGKRTKSSNARCMTFALVNPYRIDGFVNDDAKEIYLFTTDDLTGFSAEATANAHSTVKDDLTVKRNYNDDQTVILVAHDGTEHEYKVMKKYPTKIPYGFREKSIRQLFNFDPASRLGLPSPVIGGVNAYPSIGYIAGSVVVCLGDGSVPVYLDALTGVKRGTINLGSAVAGSVTSDEGGNLLITNHAEATETVKIYRTKSVTSAPELFHSFENATDVATGYNVKVHGNIDTDAVIILTHEGVPGWAATSKYTRVVVQAGTVVATETIDLSGLALGWGHAPASAAKVVSASNTTADGVFLSYYTPYTEGDPFNVMFYVNGNSTIAASLDMIANENIKISTNFNSNVLDCKTYNNATFTASLITSHFPEWTVKPRLYVYDTTSPTSIKEGKSVVSNPDIEMYQTGYSGIAAGDVVMSPSADGFKVYIFYFDHNAGVIGGYVADCIDI